MPKYKQTFRLIDGGPLPDYVHPLIDRTGVFRTYFRREGVELKRGEGTIRGAKLLAGGRVELSRGWWSYYRHLNNGTPLPADSDDDPVIASGGIVAGSWDALIAHYEAHNPKWRDEIKPNTKKARRVYFNVISAAIGTQKVVLSLKAEAPKILINKRAKGKLDLWKTFAVLVEHAVRELKWLESNAIRKIEKPRSLNKKGHHTMTEPEIAAYRAAHPDYSSDARRVFEIGLAWGARARDLLDLGWKNIEGDTISFTPMKTENSTGVEVHLKVRGDHLLKVLEHCPKGRGHKFFFQKSGTVAAARPEPRTYDALSKDWDKWRAAAGLDHVVLHSLRKTFATRMANAGVPVQRIAYALGDTIESAQIYIKAADKKQGAIAAQEAVDVAA
jgi:integrase